MSILIDVSGIESQHVVELKNFIAAPPEVDLVIQQVIASAGSDGVIDVRGTSPANTTTSFEFDIDAAASWANTTGRFTGLAAGAHTIQGRDADSTSDVSIVLTLTV